MNNEELIKIEKPNIGWSWIELEKYGLTPWENQSLKSHYKMALQIFNQYIPYFYIPKDNAIHYLIIDDNIYQLLENDVRKQYIVYFSKNILTYAKFSTRTIVKYNDWLTLLPSKISSNLEQNNQINTPRQIPKYEYFQKQLNYEYKVYPIECKYEYGALNTEDYGIYGIYAIKNDDERILLYVGMTLRTFLQRWQEHMDIITLKTTQPSGMSQVYNILRQYNTNYTLSFIPLISSQKIQTNSSTLTRRDWESMELALIHTLHPLCNQQGCNMPYLYSEI